MKILRYIAFVLVTASILPAAAQGNDVPLVPFTEDAFGIQGVAPRDWTHASAGTFVRNGGDAVLVMQAAPIPVDQLKGLLAKQLGVDALPDSSGSHQTDHFSFDLYQVDATSPTAGQVTVQVALAESNGKTYVVLLQSAPDEAAALHDSVFIPALDALAPLEATTPEAPAAPEETTVPEATATPESGITLVPFAEQNFGLQGFVPDGWTQASAGTYVRSGGTAILVIQSAAMPIDQMQALLARQGGLASFPQSTETHQTSQYNFELSQTDFTSSAGTQMAQIALTNVDGKTIVVLLLTPPDEAAALRDSVFIPVLDALAPLEVATPEPPAYLNQDAFTETDVTFGLTDWKLPGTLTMPKGDGPFPAVVLVHGSGPNDRDETLGPNKVFRDLAWGLASQGIAVLRYDKRTLVYGQQVVALPTFTLDDEVTDDAVAAVEYLRTVDGIDPNKVFVIGHSLGAMTAPRIAEHDPNIAGIVMMAAPSRNFEDVVNSQIEYQRQLAGDANPDAVNRSLAGLIQLADGMQKLRNGQDASADFPPGSYMLSYAQSIVDYNQVATAQALTIPMLIMQGGRDYQVTMEDFQGWQDALAGHDNVTFKSYPTLVHTFMALGDLSRMAIPSDYNLPGYVDPTVISDIGTWLLAH